MSVIVDGVRFPESRSNPGAPRQGWPVRKSPPHIIVAGNDNSPKRYRGGYPALAWLANRNPEGAAAIWSLRSTIEPVYLDKGGIDDDHSWDGDGIGDADVRHRIHPRVEDLLAACADRHAITPRGRHADRTGPLRDGLPAADKQYRIAEKWYRLGRAVFNVDAADDQDGLLRFWLYKGGRVQFPRVQRVPRSGSKLPVHWRTLRYMSAWFGHRRAPTPCQELEALYASECRDFHLRRRGTPLPPTVYQPTGFARVDIPHEKAELRAQLAAAMAGHPVTILPAGAAKTADRHAGNKEGLPLPRYGGRLMRRRHCPIP